MKIDIFYRKVRSWLLIAMLMPVVATASEWTQVGNNMTFSDTPPLIGDAAGWAVDISRNGQYAVVGELAGIIKNGNLSGQFRVFNLNSNGEWKQIGEPVLGPSKGRLSEALGWLVRISDDGMRVAAAAPFGDNEIGRDPGEVRVYDLTDGQWKQVGKAITGIDFFGGALDMTGDGQRVVIGSRQSNVIEVYELSSKGKWVQVGDTITGMPDTTFGSDVSINQNGMRIIVNASSIGVVQAYDLVNGNWTIVSAAVNYSDGIFSSIGGLLSLNDDGDRFIVCDGFPFGVQGKAYVYELNTAGDAWTQLGATIKDPGGQVLPNSFGSSCTMNASGDHVAVGAAQMFGKTNAPGFARVYMLEMAGNNNKWVQLGDDVVSPQGLGQDALGQSVALTTSGKCILVGAHQEFDGELNRPGFAAAFALDDPENECK